MTDLGSPFPPPSVPLADPRDVEVRVARWLVIGIAVLAAAVAWRGQFEPHLAPGRFSSNEPLLSGHRLDPNTASEAELAAVPGLGPRTAAAVVRARAGEGFWSVPELSRVPGIGASSLPELEIWLDTCLVGPPPTARRVDLNQAGPAELDRLPGIGPALAQRIVEDRTKRGAFRALADLDRVNGLGPAKLRALEGKVLPP